MQRLLRLFTVAACVLAAPSLAHANFHLWTIEEVFSNDSGDIQYIELSTTSAGQQVLAAHTITFTSNAVTTTFTFPGNSATPTNNKHLLIATPGFARLAGAVAPDFTLPCGPLFDPNASTITINFGEGQDVLTISATPIPQDGIHSLVNGVVANASPQNFAGTTGTLNLTAGENDGTTDICDDGVFCNGVEACASAACTGTDPCPGTQGCDEAGDACVPCAGDGECDDGLFCNGAETCSGGSCLPATSDACDAVTEVCDEAADACGAIPPPDAGVEVDAEVDAPDAGTTTPPDEDDGCCSTGAPASGSIALALFALVSVRRRARRR